ncbi:MAG: hypothetical protein ACN4E2_00385 [Nitrospinota bacterium]
MKLGVALHFGSSKKRIEKLSSLIESSKAPTSKTILKAFVQRILLADNIKDFQHAVAYRGKSLPYHLFLAEKLIDHAQFDQAVIELNFAKSISSKNLFIKALSCLLEAKVNNYTSLFKLADQVEQLNFRLQAKLLLEIEKEIFAQDQSDDGAEFKEDSSWVVTDLLLNIIDRFGLNISWIVAHFLNFIQNIANFDELKSTFYLINGDKFQINSNFEKAACQYQNSLKIINDHHLTLISSLSLAIKTKNIEQANQLVARLNSNIGADNDYELSLLAELAWLNKDYHSSAKFYQQLAKLDPFGYFNSYRAAIALLRQGKIEKVATLLENSLSNINPTVLRDRIATLQKLLN